jgi:anti-sigma B factor antagonist
MNISSTQEGVTALVRMAGRLDGEAALQVADTLDRLLRDGRRSVVLDMSGVTYLSSPGTLVLQHAHQEYASAKGELHVASPPPEVAETLALSNSRNGEPPDPESPETRGPPLAPVAWSAQITRSPVY